MFISYAISSKIEIHLPKYYYITHEQFIQLQWRMKTKANFNQGTNNSSKPRTTISTLYFVATACIADLNSLYFCAKTFGKAKALQWQIRTKL